MIFLNQVKLLADLSDLYGMLIEVLWVLRRALADHQKWPDVDWLTLPSRVKRNHHKAGEGLSTVPPLSRRPGFTGKLLLTTLSV